MHTFRKLPNTSPNKTVAGAVGAMILTTAVAAILGKMVFRDTEVDTTWRLILLGLILSVTGQSGDLTLRAGYGAKRPQSDV